MLFFWKYIIGSLRLTESTLPSASLLSSAKRHKSFFNFLLIANFFLSLLLLSLFMIDSDFGLSCNSFHMICLMYFILSCVLPDLYNDSNPYLCCSSICIVLLGTYHLLRDRYTRYVQRLMQIRYVQEISLPFLRRRSLSHPAWSS
jgi:cell division protein FtsW (lipid II flippase)